jgi:hypothetical protein
LGRATPEGQQLHLPPLHRDDRYIFLHSSRLTTSGAAAVAPPVRRPTAPLDLARLRRSSGWPYPLGSTSSCAEWKRQAQTCRPLARLHRGTRSFFQSVSPDVSSHLTQPFGPCASIARCRWPVCPGGHAISSRILPRVRSRVKPRSGFTGDGRASISVTVNKLSHAQPALCPFPSVRVSAAATTSPRPLPHVEQGGITFGKIVASFPFRFITCVVSPAGRGQPSRRQIQDIPYRYSLHRRQP